jgi:hypothetical protein
MKNHIKIQYSTKPNDLRVLVAANIVSEWRVVATLSHDRDVEVTPVNGHAITTYADDHELPAFLTVRHGKEYLLTRRLLGHKDVYVVVGTAVLPDAANITLV